MMQEVNPNYRYHKLWLAIGYMLVLLVIYFSVISQPPRPGIAVTKLYRVAHLQSYADDIYHLSSYFVLMLWFAQIYHAKRQRIAYAIFFIALGVALEFVQSFELDRTLELTDVVSNSLGVVIAFLITRISFLRMILLRVESHI